MRALEQAWDIEHTEEGARRHNRNAIRGIANILKDYPMLRCTVHGETGKANSAPTPLADFLRLNAISDVHECMDKLARLRAEACLEALVEEGCPREQLTATSLGMGGRIRVDFIPEGTIFVDDAHRLSTWSFGSQELVRVEKEVSTHARHRHLCAWIYQELVRVALHLDPAP